MKFNAAIWLIAPIALLGLHTASAHAACPVNPNELIHRQKGELFTDSANQLWFVASRSEPNPVVSPLQLIPASTGAVYTAEPNREACSYDIRSNLGIRRAQEMGRLLIIRVQ